MSWDSYIDNLIAQTKDSSGNIHCDRACIIGMDGSQWTTASHANALKLQGHEGVNIGKCFKNKDFTSFIASGVYAESIRYTLILKRTRWQDSICKAKRKRFSFPSGI